MHSFSSIQALEMRVLRTLYSHRHLLTNPTVKAKSFVCLNPFLKNSESTCRLVFYSSASVETVYDPISGRLVTRRHAVGSGGREQELESSSGVSGSENDAEDYEGGTVQWNLKEGELVNGSSNSSSWDGDFSEERVYATARKQTSPFRVTATSKKSKTSKKGKSKTYWVCSDCGHTEGQWWGTCRACEKVGTFKQFLVEEPNAGNTKATGFQVSDQVVQSWLPQRAGEERPVRITDVNRGLNHLDWRIPLNGRFGDEVSRVLGGGLVPGSLILVGGDPGVGKSTLLLQIGALISEGNDLGKAVPVVYVSGEESVEQICSRADRLKIVTDELYLYSSTDVEDFLQKSQALSPQALIVDSIQTAYLQEVTGSAGSITQIKECTSALLRFAKTTNIPVILIGHMTKSGEIAGPKVLEHIVDVVLYLEGEKSSSHRLLRSMKNRFGSTDELGVFEMSQLGLQPVTNPSQIYLSEEQSESEFLAGLAVAVIMDGSRSFLVEIQALCSRGLSVSRQVNGIQSGRVDMIISVLVKQAGLKLQENAIFVNVVSGLTLCETAADLAVAAAICSSFLEFPIPSGIAFIGEVGLGGELRSVPRMEKRVITLAQLGYRACIVPKSAENVLEVLDLGDMTIIGCLNLKEVINAVFVA